jgi:hypothetical protein
LVGAQRVYHGTDVASAESILRTGLDPRHGGTGGAQGHYQVFGNPEVVGNAKRKIYVSDTSLQGKGTAHAHARLSQAMKGSTTPLSQPQFQAAYQGLDPFAHRGKVLDATIPYEDFAKRFQKDPDYAPGSGAYRSEKKLDPKYFAKENRGFRGILNQRARDLGGYLKKHPARVGAGGLYGLGTLGLGYGAYRLGDHALQKEAAARFHTKNYVFGQKDALKKLGMKLTFDSPEAAQQHYKRIGPLGKASGTAGSLVGGIVGGTAGSAAGLPGTVAGSIAGSYAGEKVMQAPVTTAYDAQHDVRQRTRDTYRSSLSKMNASAGMPTRSMPLKDRIRAR